MLIAILEANLAAVVEENIKMKNHIHQYSTMLLTMYLVQQLYMN